MSSGKTYYVRAYATNSKGTTYSEQVSITMPIKDLPIVVSKPASGINSKSACLSGIIENDGNSDIQERGFYWGTDTNGFKKKIVNTASYDFTDTLTDLEPNTTYYYKAFATNSIGTSSGSLLSFTTLEKNRIVYVSSTGNNNNDGESWETAKETIFKASFNMTAGQEMWIKKGEYKDAICESEGIKIYGGFNGTETDINQRDLTSQTVIMLKTGDYFKGNDMLIDGIVFDGTKGEIGRAHV